LEKELGSANIGHFKGLTNDVQLPMKAKMGVSKFNNNIKGPLESQEVNTTYWYHSQWKEDGYVKGFNEEENKICVSFHRIKFEK
jgi:hypothetical protein